MNPYGELCLEGENFQVPVRWVRCAKRLVVLKLNLFQGGGANDKLCQACIINIAVPRLQLMPVSKLKY